MFKEWKKLFTGITVFLLFYYLPIESERFSNALLEAFHLAKWYAREHVILCLLPAFFIAGAIAVFISKASVVKYLGAKANKLLAYGVASISGTILAVCSCTVLPLFASIYKMGAGIGPATAFLYSGPAINILAIVLTARILGVQLGIARAFGAVIFSVIIGLMMQLLFKNDELEAEVKEVKFNSKESHRTLWQNAIYFLSLVGILVFANWAKPEASEGLWMSIYTLKWLLTSLFAAILGVTLIKWFNIKTYKIIFMAALIIFISFISNPNITFITAIICFSFILANDNDENKDWFATSWNFAKQITPLLLFGVLIAGALLGRVDHEGLIPSNWVHKAVGGNSFRANFFASFAGAFMYFATLTEVPILKGLINNGMGKGPALALLLSGPALSLPNMLVIKSVLGTKKTIAFVSLVIIMATISGIIFGKIS